ncbi:chaplin family protein [Streptomyces sp. NPDC051567]|uniref:chaplin n=1 Tax=Streptomyces sp. NPDC051567 TaxID=3365660 RepID=UPI00378914F6
MRRTAQFTRKTLITVAAAGGVLALAGGYAQADSGASGHATGSPGLLSGNAAQAPVDVPVNVCGNTIDVIGLLNPAFGNTCVNGPGKPARPGRPDQPGTPGEKPPVEQPPVEQLPVEPGTPGTDNPGKPGDHRPPGKPGTPGDHHPGKPGTPGDHHPGKPGTPGTGTPQTPGKPTGPGTGSVTPGKPAKPVLPVTHPGTGTVVTPGQGASLATTGSGDVLTAGVPLAGGLLIAGAVLYRRARKAA